MTDIVKLRVEKHDAFLRLIEATEAEETSWLAEWMAIRESRPAAQRVRELTVELNAAVQRCKDAGDPH